MKVTVWVQKPEVARYEEVRVDLVGNKEIINLILELLKKAKGVIVH